MPIISDTKLKEMQAQIAEVTAQYQLARTIGTREGFFQRYFKLLPDARTKFEAFEQVNREYEEIFGEEKYSDFQSFVVVYSRYVNKKM